MDIILNPTNRCNFKCEFCAASNLMQSDQESEIVKRILKQYKDKLGQVIINGGDPLMMDPSFYFDLLDYLKTLDHYVSISLTTNLYDFYKRPNRWEELFKDKRIGVITSFQYGNKRKIGNGRVFDESLFMKIIDLFNYKIGYKPNFIAVIDQSNEYSILPTIRLAKNMGIKCKLNKAIVSGRQTDYYPRYTIYKHYIDIIDNGLQEYEMNCELLYKYFKGFPTYCPIDRDCYKNLRVLNPDYSMTTCSYTAENYTREFAVGSKDSNTETFPNTYDSIKKECRKCPWFNLCNSCRIYIKEVKENKDTTNYCKEMKKILPVLKEKVLKAYDG